MECTFSIFLSFSDLFKRGFLFLFKSSCFFPLDKKIHSFSVRLKSGTPSGTLILLGQFYFDYKKLQTKLFNSNWLSIVLLLNSNQPVCWFSSCNSEFIFFWSFDFWNFYLEYVSTTISGLEYAHLVTVFLVMYLGQIKQKPRFHWLTEHWAISVQLIRR